MNRTLISILGGLGGMLGWGVSDFFANSASEKVGNVKTFFWSQLAGVLLIALFVIDMAPSFAIPITFLGLTVFCGIAYTVGYLLFYKGFEIGNVSVVSAVINIQTLFVVLISYFIRGQPLTRLQIPAIALILIGVTLVSVNFNQLKKGAVSLLVGVKETLLSSVFFGIFYWPLNEFIVERVNWLTVSFLIKLIALTIIVLHTKVTKKSLQISKPTSRFLVLLAAVGALEALAVLSTTFGQSFGDGIIVAPISSALTIVTIGLAVVFLKEKITKVQGVGIFLTVGGIIMTAV
jgi:drug/metabolite transporter (DMT)-like permease